MGKDVEAAERLGEVSKALRSEVGKVIIGQERVVEQILITLFANAHCFMVGVPGLAKTLIVSTLAKVLNLSFKRIQFTPDLMPSDITGTDVMQEDPETSRRKFIYNPGPIFANMILADEINRTPPKTQAALLEAMQERQVTAGRRTYELEPPFFVLATQNPIEQEGTYPLPEAQLDRFMLNVLVEYPEAEAELSIYKNTTVKQTHEIKPLLNAQDILELQEIVLRVPVAEHVFQYVLELVRKTRPESREAPGFVRDWLEVGAGPRAGQNLILGAKVRALMNGRFYATCEDVAELALPVLRHRLIANFNAETEGVKTDDIIRKLLQTIPIKMEPPRD